MIHLVVQSMRLELLPTMVRPAAAMSGLASGV
jgi:hypothetical protein